MHLDLSENIQRLVYLGTYEPVETRAFRRHLQPGMSVVDVGANIGYFTLLAARLVGPAGRVVAVEPSPVAGERIANTLRENAIEHVRLEQCGLGRAPGQGKLYDPPPQNYSPTMFGEPGSPNRLVPIRTLDELAHSLGLDQIDFLKIDVEGYEPEVIGGAKDLIAKGRIRAVLCEFNEYWLNRAGTTGMSFYHDLLALGFVDTLRGKLPPGEELETRLFLYNSPSSR